jgi:adenylate cyclase
VLNPAKRRILWGSIIALLSALAANAGSHLSVFEELEWKTFDGRAKFFSSYRQLPDEIAVILIDEQSIRQMNRVVGRWPWPRSVHADLIDFLSLGGAKAVVFDILFTENELTRGVPADVQAANDLRLAESTGAAGNIYHAAQIFADTEDEFNNGLLNRPLPADFAERFSVKCTSCDGGRVDNKNNICTIPFKELYEAAKGVGVVDISPDSDGIYRRTELFRAYQGKLYPLLSVSPLIDILRLETIHLTSDSLYLTPGLSVPLQKGSYLINMYENFRPYSASGIMASIQKIKLGEPEEELPIAPSEFMDKVVFIGASAVGVEDIKPNPLHIKSPGVFLQASVYGNIVQRDFLRHADPFLGSLLVLLLSGLVVSSVLLSSSIIYQASFPILLTVTYGSLVFWFFWNNIILELVAPVSAIFLSWMGSFAYLSVIESRDKRKIRRMLGQYVSPAILSTVIDKASHDVLKAEVGTREELTILFSDIRDFTSMSESLAAETVVDILNGYFSGIVDIIFRLEGTLDKFIGDAVMAFWGAPIRVEDHAKRAVTAAIEITRWVGSFNESLAAKGLSPLQIGVGINTGPVLLGNIGSEKKLDYTIVGDNVNLASRLEGLTKRYRCPILITGTTYKQTEGSILCRVVDYVRVDGKSAPIQVYEVLGLTADAPESVREYLEIASLTEEGLDCYRKRMWKHAKDKYSEILSMNPNDRLSQIFIERCEAYIAEEPPADWEGVQRIRK